MADHAASRRSTRLLDSWPVLLDGSGCSTPRDQHASDARCWQAPAPDALWPPAAHRPSNADSRASSEDSTDGELLLSSLYDASRCSTPLDTSLPRDVGADPLGSAVWLPPSRLFTQAPAPEQRLAPAGAWGAPEHRGHVWQEHQPPQKQAAPGFGAPRTAMQGGEVPPALQQQLMSALLLLGGGRPAAPPAALHAALACQAQAAQLAALSGAHVGPYVQAHSQAATTAAYQSEALRQQLLLQQQQQQLALWRQHCQQLGHLGAPSAAAPHHGLQQAAAPPQAWQPAQTECLVGAGGASQSYCTQVITPELNDAALHMLRTLRCAHLAEAPLGGRALGKRFVCSIKEVLKVAHCARAIIVAPDVRYSPTAVIDPVRLLQCILRKAQDAGVPVVFALSRRGIGQVFGPDKNISVVAVMRAEHCEPALEAMLALAAAGRARYAAARGAGAC